jgi:hypothetical protein
MRILHPSDPSNAKAPDDHFAAELRCGGQIVLRFTNASPGIEI